ncbi:hypothetical protein [Tenacibaculum halocynthiae]|uniref:hypothetical protein n=1 Tax=Tenacibaculum halocynthiae TaxID=1254437 RepID=UPI003895AD02
MKTTFKILAIVMVLGFISCTDNDEILEQQQHEEQEVLAIDKDDVENPGGGGETDPDDTEG